MSRYRIDARVDENQPEIVKQLRSIPGVTVQTGVDDILIGYRGVNYWVEIKDPAKTLKKNGELKADALKDSQKDLLRDWRGQYLVAWSLEQILKEIGINAFCPK